MRSYRQSDELGYIDSADDTYQEFIHIWGRIYFPLPVRIPFYIITEINSNILKLKATAAINELLINYY